ncbi:MAG: hypothetical protein KY456_17510 [Chloroflexi bacterium]|nr:hypothetical protein [Chloroflexota bacterium]
MTTESTRSSDPEGWLIKPAEAPELARLHRAHFRGWVTCGERDDYAWVYLDPPFLPTDSGISDSLETVLLAPRHQGVFLNGTEMRWPVHVYLLTAPPDLYLATDIPPDALKIRLWGVLEGALE